MCKTTSCDFNIFMERSLSRRYIYFLKIFTVVWSTVMYLHLVYYTFIWTFALAWAIGFKTTAFIKAPYAAYP